MRANFIILGLATVLVGGCLLVYLKGHTPTTIQTYQTAATSTSGFQYEVVSSPEAQAKGLGERADVPQNYGMLFAFPTDKAYGFWMKDMQVPIDIIWLSDTGTILGIDADVATSSYPSVFYPPEPVRYVLETRSGEALRQGWSTSTQLSVPSQK